MSREPQQIEINENRTCIFNGEPIDQLEVLGHAQHQRGVSPLAPHHCHAARPRRLGRQQLPPGQIAVFLRNFPKFSFFSGMENSHRAWACWDEATPPQSATRESTKRPIPLR